jgi:hypothetical protein
MAKTTKGWIKLHRQIKSSAVWNDPLRLKAWIDILISANTEDKEWFASGRLYQIKRGQYPTSNRKLQEAWGCSTNTVDRILKQFQDLGMIKVEKPHKRYTLLTVVKYGDFQNRGYVDRDSDGDIDRDNDRDSDGDNDGVQLKNNIRIYKNNKEQENKKFDAWGIELEE